MCGNDNSFDKTGNDFDQYSQWTAIDSSNITVAFYADDSVALDGWSMEFGCVGDRTTLKPCNTTESSFGQVHYSATENMEYGATDERNIITVDVAETECPQVIHAILCKLRWLNFNSYHAMK